MRIISINVHYQDGLGYQDYYLGKELKKMGHEVHFISSDWHFRFPDYKNTVEHIIGPRYVGDGVFMNEYGCKVHRLKSKLINSVYWLKGFKEKIEELQPDLIISHGVFTFQSIRLSFWGKKLKCPIIYDDHTTSTFVRNTYTSKITFAAFRLLFAKRIYKSANKVVGISASCIPVLKNTFGISGEKVKMIPLGADTDTYFPDSEARLSYRKELSIRENDILIVYTGKIYDAKRLHIIFESLNNITSPPESNIVFHVVGDIAKDYEPIFENSQKEFKHKLIYRKAVNQITLSKIYNAADLCIWLDFTNSTIEASACGCPVIVTDLMPERVENGSGILVNRESHIEIIDSLKQLINSKSAREEMSKKGYLHVKNKMTWKVHSKDLVS